MTEPAAARRPKALAFDVFGTVVDWRTSIARESAAFLTQIDRSDIDPHDFADQWRRRYLPAMAAVSGGQRGFVKLDILHREMLGAVLDAQGIDPAALDQTLLADWTDAWHRLDPWPDSVAGIARLRTAFPVSPPPASRTIPTRRCGPSRSPNSSASGGARKSAGVHRGRPFARRGAGSCAVLRAAGARQDHAGADRRARARGRLSLHFRPGDRQGGRSRRAADQSRGPHDVLFIDEIHRLNPVVEEILYPAMEDRALDIIIGEGPSARSRCGSICRPSRWSARPRGRGC
jgi:hypothetical protein